MSDIERQHEAAKATELTACASAVETAIVGVLSVVVEDESVDAEVQDIIGDLRRRAHRLRRIASKMTRR
jgi:hypothetical protein